MVSASGLDPSLRFYRDPAGYVLDVGYAPSPAFRVGQLIAMATPGSAYCRSADTKGPAAERADEILPTV
jgi:hypothetical protein